MNSQRSLTDQLRELYALANRNGLYDAADFVLAHADRIDRTELEEAGIDVDSALQRLQATIDRLSEHARFVDDTPMPTAEEGDAELRANGYDPDAVGRAGKEFVEKLAAARKAKRD